jgi:RHS repeat-associated protein
MTLSSACASRFTGKERDTESGLDYFGARYYASNMGRFMSPDPTGGKLDDPQSLNRYVYVRNNPLSYTDPTGLNFGLPCSGGNTDSCNNGLQGSWQHDADGNKTSFTNISIGNKDGQLQDVSSNNTGSYTASFDGKNVSLTNSSGGTQNGSWLQGTADVKGVSGGGDLSSKFTFNFSNHGDGQRFNASFTYAGSIADAEAELKNVGYQHWNAGKDIGYSEWRLPADGRNSSHFNIWDPNSVENVFLPTPKDAVPGNTSGNMHAGEYYPGYQHTACDVMGLCK